jgi:2,4-didehydro-3-deoxy-L-rhamnonate hydrolase
VRLVSFGEAGREQAGVVEGDRILPMLELRPSWPRSWREILGGGLFPSVAAALDEARRTMATTAPERFPHLAGVRLGPPIPNPTKVVAIGLNYRDHALEQKKEPPAAPLLFAKAPSCLVGPYDPIHLPDEAVEDQVDAEAELCVVMACAARNVTESLAMASVLGFTIMNDVSGRASQYGDKQWFRGKSFDSFGPCGPWVITRDELPDPSGLALEADWGGRPMQRGNTADLIFSVSALVSYVSRMMTLCPGDLITTGTPAGVGVFRDPPVFLRRGEDVVIRLERVGEIRNPVV